MNSKYQKGIVNLAVLALVVGMLGYFGYNQIASRSAKPHDGSVDKLVLSNSPGMSSAPVLVAHDKGYFKEVGLDITIENFPTGKAALADMLEGNSDMATSAQIPVVLNSFARDDYKVVAEFVASNDNEKVISLRRSGITKIADLKDKRVGLPTGTSAAFFFDTYIKLGGLAQGDVTIVGMGPAQMQAALENSSVDAVVIWEPTAHLVQGYFDQRAVRLPAHSEVYRASFDIVASDNFIKTNPRAVSKFLLALQMANKFMVKNEGESQKIVARALGTDESVVTALWNKYTFKLFLSQETVQSMESQGLWLIQQGLVNETEIPNYLDFIFSEVLEELDPRAVTLI